MEPVRSQTSPRRAVAICELKEAAMFEGFLHRKFPGQTRFSLEGGEALIPLLEAAVFHAAALGVTDLILGMPHRGRLTVLATVFRRPIENIFAEFSDNAEHGVVGEGDVKYHRGFSTGSPLGGSPFTSPRPNPGHQAVGGGGGSVSTPGPAATGKGKRCGGLIMATPPSAAGGGGETAASRLEVPDGGILHIVLNNRCSPLPPTPSRAIAPDIAKMVMAPIFHVTATTRGGGACGNSPSNASRPTAGRGGRVICYRRHGTTGGQPYFAASQRKIKTARRWRAL
jgi:2-oxoglutarate dehydrogenase E1 component